MPAPNWDAFVDLSGPVTRNFEQLCRALIRRNYGRYGAFRALASQPGVEFDLRLDRDCALGASGRWFGWQCRWYDLASGEQIGSRRRGKIVDAIRKTECTFPEITDWVLWTRHPLTAGDQAWLQSISTDMRLYSWAAAEVEELLSGEANILRSTYFGELILTPDALATLHERAVAPVAARWQVEVHQVVDVERVVHEYLADPGAWPELVEVTAALSTSAERLRMSLDDVPPSLRTAADTLQAQASAALPLLANAVLLLEQGDLERLLMVIDEVDRLSNDEPHLPRRLRAARVPAAAFAANVLADLVDARVLLRNLAEHIRTPLVSIVAEAGCGKTELAISLTSPQDTRPAGLLLHGSGLSARHTLDDLARHVVIQARPVMSAEALVSALDAAGQRAGRRLPLVLDGLNEAEDPRVWQAQLAQLRVTLSSYPWVLVVVTVRPSFVNEAVPAATPILTLPGFDQDTQAAVDRYFAYYRISRQRHHVRLPISLLSHPLTLRLFCEVTNPTRTVEVGIEAMPTSLTALFDRYLDQVAYRIASLSPAHARIDADEVRDAYHQVGLLLWEHRERSIDVPTLRLRINDHLRPWNLSLLRALEQDRVLLRIPTATGVSVHRVSAVYDRLAGHLIARALLTEIRSSDLAAWIRQDATLNVFADPQNSHPLAGDIFQGLVGIVPRVHPGQQLWRFLEEPLRTGALNGALALEADLLDDGTVAALRDRASSAPQSLPGLFLRLWQTYDAPAHPLNARFMDDILREMTVTERDLTWTEWTRRHTDELMVDLNDSIGYQSSETIGLVAAWAAWLTTSTVRPLRDAATLALHRLGLRNSAALSSLVGGMLSVNDPYVAERVLAAACGMVIVRRQITDDLVFRQRDLPRLAKHLYEQMFAHSASTPTTHVLCLFYARRILHEALAVDPAILGADQAPRIVPPYPLDLRLVFGECADEDVAFDAGDVLDLDFGNYTLGRLVPDRNNYDYDDPNYRRVYRHVLWRIHDLGYRTADFKEIDSVIRRADQSGRSGDGRKTERYGKKYAWVAFYELAGQLLDDGQLKGKYIDLHPIDFVDIDPTFPDAPRDLQIFGEDLLGRDEPDIARWIREGADPRLDRLLRFEGVAGEDGPWLTLDAFVNQHDALLGRISFVSVRALLIPMDDAPALLPLLRSQAFQNSWLPENSETHETYAADLPAGESGPWKDITFQRSLGREHVPERKLEFRRDGIYVSDAEVEELISTVLNAPSRTQTPLARTRAQNRAWRNELERRDIQVFEVVTAVERDRVESHSFNVFIPTEDASWPEYKSASNTGWSVAIPTRALIDDLELRQLPKAFDWIDARGELQAVYVQNGIPHRDQQHFSCIREATLRLFMEQQRLKLVWAVWGERTLTFEELESPQNQLEQHYQVFSRVFDLDD